jgi:hypothetical protein
MVSTALARKAVGVQLVPFDADDIMFLYVPPTSLTTLLTL